MAEAVTVVALVQSIITLSDKIRQAAKGVYYLQEKCAKLGSLVEEIRSSLGDSLKHKEFNKQSWDRLLQLKRALEDAEVFLRDMSRWRKAVPAYVFGGASSRLDDIEKEILRSSHLLAFHVGLNNHRLLHGGFQNYITTLCSLFGMGLLVIVLFFIYFYYSHDLTSTFKGWVLHPLLLQRFHNFILV